MLNKQQQRSLLLRPAGAALGLLFLSRVAVFGFEPSIGVRFHSVRQGSHLHIPMSLAVSTVLGDWDETLSEVNEQHSVASQKQQRNIANQWSIENARSAQYQQYHAVSPALELPMHSTVVKTVEPTTLLSSMEVALGRAAMIAAVVLLANEIATGQSLPDQVIAIVTNCLVQ